MAQYWLNIAVCCLGAGFALFRTGLAVVSTWYWRCGALVPAQYWFSTLLCGAGLGLPSIRSELGCVGLVLVYYCFALL